jgi:hypothetical protein
MPDLDALLAADRQAVATFFSVARSLSATAWTASPAPGRWSPARIAEHLAIAHELGRAAVTGTFPRRAAPGIVRYLLRTFFLNPVVRNGRFKSKSKTPAPFRPTMEHPFFGTLRVVDYLGLQIIHTNHHRSQLPAAAYPPLQPSL